MLRGLWQQNPFISPCNMMGSVPSSSWFTDKEIEAQRVIVRVIHGLGTGILGFEPRSVGLCPSPYMTGAPLSLPRLFSKSPHGAHFCSSRPLFCLPFPLTCLCHIVIKILCCLISLSSQCLASSRCASWRHGNRWVAAASLQKLHSLERLPPTAIKHELEKRATHVVFKKIFFHVILEIQIP